MTIFPACGPKEDGTWMSCHYAQLTVFVLGIIMTGLSIAAVFVRKRAVVLYALTVLCAFSAAVLPANVIRLCLMNEMQCRAVMRPSVILLSILIIAFSLISAAVSRTAGRQKPTAGF